MKLNFCLIFALEPKSKAMVHTKLNDYTAFELWTLYAVAKAVGQKDLADKLLADYYFLLDMDLEKSN